MDPKYFISTLIIATLCLLLLIVVLGAAIRGVPLTESGLATTEKLILALVALVSYLLGREERG